MAALGYGPAGAYPLLQAWDGGAEGQYDGGDATCAGIPAGGIGLLPVGYDPGGAGCLSGSLENMIDYISFNASFLWKSNQKTIKHTFVGGVTHGVLLLQIRWKTGTVGSSEMMGNEIRNKKK